MGGKVFVCFLSVRVIFIPVSVYAHITGPFCDFFSCIIL